MSWQNLVVMNSQSGSHPTDEELELYSLNRLEEPDLARLEEHLLVCEACQKRLEDIDEFVGAMRVALKEIEAREAHEPAQRRGLAWGDWGKWLFGLPKPVWAGLAAAGLILIAVLAPWRSSTQGSYQLELSAWRSGAPVLAVAPSGAQLTLRLDTTGLPGGPYEVEVVDASGRPLWRGAGSLAENRLVVAPGLRLPPGRYWVRIYSSEPAVLLREFGFEVRKR